MINDGLASKQRLIGPKHARNLGGFVVGFVSCTGLELRPSTISKILVFIFLK